MAISNLTLQKEEKLIVGFIDLLGFESDLNDDSFEKLFDLLKQLTGLKKNFCEKQIGITKEGNKQYSIEPSITAFSDSVVISYELGGVLPPVAIFTELSRNIAHIALIALSNGFLIRGAITQGKARHKDNIILGAPFIEAYKLERDVADMPRILIQEPLASLYDLHEAPKVYHAATKELYSVPECMFLLKETSNEAGNIYSLNYIREALIFCLPHGGSWYENMKVRIHEIRNIIVASKRIINLTQSDYSGEILKKWMWFEKHFEIEVEKWTRIMDVPYLAAKDPCMS